MLTVGSNPHVPFKEGLENGWQCVSGPPPEKVFVWDREGTYVDCQFPNPLFDHFLGGSTLLGKRVTEVLPPEAAGQVLKGIQRVLAQREPSQLWIRLLRNGVCYQICLRLFPSGQLVVGWVNDFPTTEGQESAPMTNGVQKAISSEPIGVGLSEQEQKILKGIVAGHTNKHIAEGLGIKEGTAKYHLSNIYRKLNLTSRVQLALRGETLLSESSGGAQ